MNIDGITAVIFCELGFEPELGRGIFALSRSVGILAHAWEQKQRGRRIMGPMPRGIPYRYSGPARRAVPRCTSTGARRLNHSFLRTRQRATGLEDEAMKDQIANQLVKYLEARGVEHIFGLCGHTNIAVLAALSKSEDQVRQHAARADRGARRRRLCAGEEQDVGRAVAPRPRAHERRDRRRQRRARLDPDGGDRRRRPDPLLRQASAPGGQPARRRVAVRDLPAVRQARLARGSPHLFPEIIEKAFALAESGRPGPVLVDVPMDIFSKEIDVELFDRLRLNTKRSQAVDRRGDGGRDRRQARSRRRGPVLYVGGGIMLADATAELREFVDHLQIPVAHTLMGKGALPDDHPFVLGMTGFWGTKFINDQCRGGRLILGLGTRFSEADCSSWEPEYTFNIPPTKLIHIDIDPAEIGRNYPGRDRRRRRSQAGAERAEPSRAQLRPDGRQAAGARERDRRGARRVRRRQQGACDEQRLSDAPERILADVREALPRNALITTDVGWNKNGVGQQFPILDAGHDLHAGRLRDDGLRRARGARRQDRMPRPRGRRARGRRRVRPEPGDARDRVRGRTSRSCG